MRQELMREKEAALAQYRGSGDPQAFFRRYGAALEALLVKLWQQYFSGCPYCLLAVGGFGRGEVYPHSDLDLALVAPAELSAEDENRIAGFVQALWDMGLAPAVKSGSLKQLCAAAAQDVSADTAFLEARLLCGEEALAQRLRRELDAQRDTAAFVEAKLVEMQRRHACRPALVLEPDVKNGSGGLRDLHTMMWLAQVQGLQTGFYALMHRRIITRIEAGLLRSCHRELARLRIDLHLAAGRAEERLVFDLQAEIGCRRYPDLERQAAVEKLMHGFYRTVKTVIQLNGILIPMLRGRVYSALPRVVGEIDADYYLLGKQIAVRDLKLFEKRPQEIFGVVSRWQLNSAVEGMAPKTLRAWWAAVQSLDGRFYADPANRARFLGFFQAGANLSKIMRFLNLYGVLARYLPGWKAIVGLLQHDLFHVYPVDDHILMVLAKLRRLALEEYSHEMPFASALMHAFEPKWLLYLAALFHDIAKGRNGDHAKLGMEDARRFAADHGLSADECELLVWLVEDHLLMSSVAQKEDIQDPETVERFCRRVRTPQRLRALYLLTVADICGTNPKIWNSWKDQLLKQLFQAALRRLSGESGSRESMGSRRRAMALAVLAEQGKSEREIRSICRTLGEAYFVRHEPEEILWHLQVLPQKGMSNAVAGIRSLDAATLQIVVFMPNADGLFARLCRLFSRNDLDIAAARAFVTEHDFILDTFVVRLPEYLAGSDSSSFQAALQRQLDDFLAGRFAEKKDKRQASRRARSLPIAPHIELNADPSQPDWYVLELVAVNRPYLLADISEVFARRRISVRHAKISTLDDRAEDSFLLYSAALADPAEEVALKRDLLAVLNA